MNKTETRIVNALDINDVLGNWQPRHVRNKIHQDVIQLQAIARRLHLRDEQACNVGLSQHQQTEVNNLELYAQAILAGYGLEAYHQSDPRGWPLYILPPGHKPNDVRYTTDGSGICPY